MITTKISTEIRQQTRRIMLLLISAVLIVACPLKVESETMEIEIGSPDPIIEDSEVEKEVTEELEPVTEIETEESSYEETFAISYDSVYELDLRTMVIMDAKQLDSALYHGLRGKAELFIQKSEEYQINVFFICAVAANESGWGQSYLAQYQNNYFGIMGKNGYASFDSFEDNLDYFCRLVSEGYLVEDGFCYNGVTIRDVNIAYCPVNYQWSTITSQIMVEIYVRTTTYEEEVQLG